MKDYDIIEVECGDCEDGIQTELVSRFSTAQEQWYPDYREVLCETCGGHGTIQQRVEVKVPEAA